MSPRIENVEFENQQFITITLNDSEPFDPEKFDKLAKAAVELKLGTYPLKYIVSNDLMYIFPRKLRHSDVETILNANGITGKLQSAGYVSIIETEEGSSFRIIDEYSSTLSSILSRTDSDNYKNTVIKEKLGEYFKVT